jgi:hypothetical protein
MSKPHIWRGFEDICIDFRPLSKYRVGCRKNILSQYHAQKCIQRLDYNMYAQLL